MYYEVGHFLRRFVFQKSLWKDGELWTAVIGGLASFFWLRYDPEAVEKIRQHFGDLLNVTSIVFGFALAAIIFYIEAAGSWAKNDRVQKVAERLVDWHVWTLICLLFQIAYILGLWALGCYLDSSHPWVVGLYAFLCFLVLYCGFQILNHTLTVWWAFHRRDRLSESFSEKKSETEGNKHGIEQTRPNS